MLQEVVGIAPDAGSSEVAQWLGGNEAGDGVANGCDSGYASVFHGLANAVEVVAGIVDVSEVYGVLEGDKGAVWSTESATQGVELAVMEPESNFEDMAGGKGLRR